MFINIATYGLKKSSVAKSKNAKEIETPVKPKPEIFMTQRTFLWQIVTDKKMIEANTVFKERIKFDTDYVAIEENFKDVAFDFNSTIKPDENGELDNPSYISKTLIYKFEIKKDLLILTETDSKIVKKFKIFFNKNKEAIRLQNVDNKRFYDPTTSHDASKSM